MNKKALYGILIAVLLPLAGYIYLKQASDHAVVMPKHFIVDSINTSIKNGKQHTDTVWKRLPDISLTNQLGNTVSWKDMQGKIAVADFFFTHCPNICPNMTRAMKMLQDGIKSSDKVGNREAMFVQFLSFSIDPERDSVPQLKKWNDQFQIDAREWWLLTGNKQAIYDLSIKDMMLMAQDGGPVDSNFIHTDMFVLIDTNRYVRGYYHVLKPDHSIDSSALSRLSSDIVLLSLEKDPNKKFFLSGKLELIAVVFMIAAIGLVLLFTYLNKEKKRL